MFAQIKQHKVVAANRLISGFGQNTPEDSSLEKAIAIEDFDDQYGVGFNIFNRESIDKFRQDALEKGDSTDEIEVEIGKLQRVLVQKGEEIFPLYLMKIEE